ncbi:MAG: type VI secretion system lipoprotein TssJ [Gammaproteobacteria bacterium]|nr:type VI secretion system lipoprotein TssJ [Gammaproteobacteria bacterium]
MIKLTHHLLIFFLLASLISLVSCTSTEVIREVMDPKNLLSTKTKLDLTVNTSADLNPDQSGRPSPVVVRLYSLVSPTHFENADFVSLYHNDQAVLGTDFLRKEEKDFQPSEKFSAQLDFNEKANFIGIMVAYQDIEQANWRLILPLERGKHNYLNIKLTADSVLLEQEK